MSDHDRTIALPFTPIHTHELYQTNVFDIVRLLAECMHLDSASPTKAPWRLYTQLVHQGYKYRGVYEIQMPHLVRFSSTKHTTTTSSMNTLSYYDYRGNLMFRSLVIQPTQGIQSGLYTCHLQLHLSNPHWRLEDVVYDPDTKQWTFQTPRAPHPRECKAQFVITPVQRIGDLPEDKQESDPAPPSPIWTSIREPIQNFVTEFRRVFYSSC